MSQATVSRAGRGTLFGVPVAYIAIWAAVYAVASILPAIPLVGGGTFGAQEFILPLAGILFGPIGGAIAAGLGGLIASFIGPATAYFGVFTFYSHAIGAFVAGLLMQNTKTSRLISLALLIVAMAAWPLLPWFSTIGSYVYAEWAYWPMHLTALIGLLLTPWAVEKIRTFDPKQVWMGVAVISWTAYMINHVWVSLGFSYLYPQGPESWVFAFWSGIVPAQRLLLTAASTIVGAALIVGLHRAGVRFPAETGSALAEEEDEL